MEAVQLAQSKYITTRPSSTCWSGTCGFHRNLNPGTCLYDRRLGRERLLHHIEIHGSVASLSFLDPQTGGVDRQPFPLDEIESRFEVLEAGAAFFRGDPETVRLIAEAYRLQHAYLFNPVFATETSLIDLLPHQLAAVYGMPPSNDNPDGRPGMIDLPRLRFLLADDARAGKAIMAGLTIREILLRRKVWRVLVVAPAGLRRLFGLRFRILSGSDLTDTYNPFEDPRNDLAIISVDTLARERMRSAYEAAPPYDLVVFDEAHKLSAWRESDLSVRKSLRYRAAETIALQGRHLLLMTATPHMRKDDPYCFLWRLLEPELFSTPEALRRLPRADRHCYILRRVKEEMVRLARAVYDLRRESKFERLWEALEAYPDTKVLIFTEFRDTLEFLLRRLEGKRLTGKVAHIHGGMDYKERARQVDFFRDPHGARIMVATDAAGEGINLQFCWLLINHDIPWNPARIEQRMGPVHRYKQEHNVLLLNAVAAETREGRVLKVLLEKPERIRKELGTEPPSEKAPTSPLTSIAIQDTM